MAISPQMQTRLDSIDALAKNGYTIQKEFGAFPVLTSANGSKKPINIFSNPAGFSWIGFFFPFAVCAQIKEWSYFYVSGSILFLASIVSSVVHVNLSNASSITIAVMYGMYFPYLRYLARERNVEEVSVGLSILIGLLLALVAAIPSIIVDYNATTY